MKKFYLGFGLGVASTVAGMVLKKKVEEMIVTEAVKSVFGKMISDKLPEKSEMRKDPTRKNIEVAYDEKLEYVPAFKPVVTFLENFAGSTIKFFSGLKVTSTYIPAALITSKRENPQILSACIYRGDLNTIVILDAKDGSSMITDIDNNEIPDFNSFINAFKDMII